MMKSKTGQNISLKRPLTQTNVVLFANQDNGYNITKYLFEQADTNIKTVVVYPNTRGQWWKSVLDFAKKNNLEYIVYKSDVKLLNTLNKHKYDFLISANWRHKISVEVLKLAKIGNVNMHNSLLPKYAGVYATSWPIYHNEKKAGVTLHWMSEKLDRGDIIFQKRFSIAPWHTCEDLWKITNRHTFQMFKQMWKIRSKWRSISHPQKGKFIYYSSKDFIKNNLVDINKNVKIADFINYLRAKSFSRYNNAYYIDSITKKKIYISINLHP